MGLKKWVKRSCLTVICLLGVMMAGNVAEADTSINYNAKQVHLNGTSVIIEDSTNGKTAIYLDEDRNGEKDSSTPIYDLNLSEYWIFGEYGSNVTQDMSIIMHGGTVECVYGAYAGTAKSVKIEIDGGTIAKELMVANKNAKVETAELIIKGGTFQSGAYVVCGDGATISGDAVLQFSGNAELKEGNAKSLTKLLAVNNSTVAGDVKVRLGKTSKSTTARNYTEFFACSDSTVNGNLNVTIDGYWNDSKAVYLLGDAADGNTKHNVLKGNFVLDWLSGNVIPHIYCIYDGTVAGDFFVDVKEGAVTENGKIWMANTKKTVRNVEINVPSCNGNITTSGSDKLSCTGYKWANEPEATVLSGKTNGEYVIDRNWTFKKFTTSAGTECRIANGVTVTLGDGITNSESNSSVISGNLVNNGTMISNMYLKSSATVDNNGKITCNSNWEVSGILRNYGTIDCKAALRILGTGGLLDNYKTVTTKTDSGETPYVYVGYGTLKNEAGATINVNCRLSNLGKIVNYGQFVQSYTNSSYNNDIGEVYTTEPLRLSNASLDKYTSIYYKITKEYPSNYIDANQVTLDSVVSGNYTTLDGIAYMKAGQQFKVTVGTLKTNTYVLGSVTYGVEEPATKSQSGAYIGTMPYKVTTVILNFVQKGQETTNISLAKPSDRVENLKVGQYNACFYDLKTLEINGDSATGMATFSQKSGYSLPEGLSLSAEGKIYGTPTKAKSGDTTTIFIVKGANQTTAEFSLTFGTIAKGDVALSLPTGLSSTYRSSLKSIALPTDSRGSYSWENGDTVLTSVSTTGIRYNVRFTPKDTANYDWEHAAVTTDGQTTDFTYSGGVITTTVLIKIAQAEPDYQSKLQGKTFSVVYGKTLRDIALPSGPEGAFSWQDSLDTDPGDVGSHEFCITYTPTDSGYKTKKDISIQVNVTRAVPVLAESVIITEINALYGDTLAKVNLKQVTGGTYQWITDPSTKVQNGSTYTLGYYPYDVTNYDWSTISGSNYRWNSAKGCVEFSVIANVTKAKPVFTDDMMFDSVEAVYGDTLSDIKFKTVPGGIYQWITTPLTTKLINGAFYTVGYKPTDVEHYDWSKIDGWNEETGCVHFTVEAHVAKATPVFTDDMKLTSIPVNAGDALVYGDTLADVKLGAVSGGSYVWQEDTSTLVQNGTSYKLGYKPNDTEHYDWEQIAGWNAVSGCVEFSVVAHVEKATPKIEKAPIKLVSTIGKPLSDFKLPTVNNKKWYDDEGELKGPLVSADDLPNGRLEFEVSSPQTINEFTAKSVKLSFIPTDTEHYNMVNNISIIIEIDDPEHQHKYGETWESDGKNHWKSCESCGAMDEYGNHQYDSLQERDAEFHEGTCSVCNVVVTAKHTWSEGVKTDNGVEYICTNECGARIKHIHAYSDWEKVDENSHKRACECGVSETQEHDWDDGTETAGGKKSYQCKICNTIKLHIHTYGNCESVDENTHKKVCTDCGHVMEAEHNWNSGETTTNGIKYTCTDCKTTKEHTHAYGDLIKKDEATHCRICDCGAVTQVGNHVYGEWKNKDYASHRKRCECGAYVEEAHKWNGGEELEDDRTKYTCTECNAVKTHEHDFGEWKHNEVSHWKECACNVKTNPEEHTYSEWEQDEDKHWRTCECGYVADFEEHEWIAGDKDEEGNIEYTCKCGFVKYDTDIIKHVHNWSDEWISDANGHWNRCIICEETTLPSSHTWSDGEKTSDGKMKFVCTVCGYARTEDIPETPQPPTVGPSQNVVVTPVGGVVTSVSQNAAVKVTKMGVLDSNGNLVGAEAVYVKPANRTSKVVIPDVVYDEAGLSYKVTAIAKDAFKNDKKVTTVKIGNNIPKIEANAFSGCVKLKTVTTGSGITEIGDKAFYKCSALTKITVPRQVTKIGKQAFAGCKKLKTITIKSANLKKVGSKAISGINKKAVIKVPKKKLKAYKKLFKAKSGFKKGMKIKG